MHERTPFGARAVAGFESERTTEKTRPNNVVRVFSVVLIAFAGRVFFA